MTALRGMYPLDSSTPSLRRDQPRLIGHSAPPGTLFVLGDDGGYAATRAPANRLILGRNSNAVHVTVGSGDWNVSREQASMRCDPGLGWRLRNDGRLPIRLPDLPELLREHEVTLPTGYTPLYINGSRRHIVEILVSGDEGGAATAGPETGTRDISWPLAARERLVLVAMFQNHLLRVADPHPLSWRETSHTLNQVPGQAGWTERKAEHVVDGVRHRLARGGHDGVTADSAPPEAIKNNLLKFLTDTATLVPPDLRLLETGTAADGGEAR